MKIQAFYDYSENPLVLTADAAEQDELKLIVYPYRLELYVNDVLTDEEWPCGKLQKICCEPEIFAAQLQIVQGNEKDGKETIPAVTGEFDGADGWMPGKGVFAGDCMPYTYGGRYHVLYLKDRHHHHSKWGKGAHQWAHISSADLKHWQIHPMAVEIDDPNEGSICTGSFMAHAGKQYLFYTVRTMDGSPAPIRRSVSEDGYHFEKDRDFSFTLSARYTGASARDPKVVQAADGSFHMFVTSTEVSSGCGVLVHLVSADLSHWKEEAEPIYRSPDSDEPECSDYIAYHGHYYLIFSHHGSGQYLYSGEPFSGWQVPKTPEIPCESVPKAAVFEDRILFAGFKRIEGYAGTLTFKTAYADADGELYYPGRGL